MTRPSLTIAALTATLLLGACGVQAQHSPANKPLPAPTQPTQPNVQAAQSANDSAVTMRVKAALMAHGDLQGLPIEVQTTNGTVTLNGTVTTPTAKERAQQAVAAVSGVKGVDNQLIVKAPA